MEWNIWLTFVLMMKFEESDQASLINWLLKNSSPEFQEMFASSPNKEALMSHRFVIIDVTNENTDWDVIMRQNIKKVKR